MPFADAWTDRQAADAVRSRIDWPYALGLERTDASVHNAVLSKCRTRLVTGGAAPGLLDVRLTRFHAGGLLNTGGRARTDSTPVVAAIRALNRWAWGGGNAPCRAQCSGDRGSGWAPPTGDSRRV